MELKRSCVPGCFSSLILLIVPYGIETLQAWAFMNSKFLLIVPYGIETIFV